MNRDYEAESIKYFVDGTVPLPEKLNHVADIMIVLCKAMDMDFMDFKDYTRIKLWEKFRNG